ncbi:uncharacterized protein [Watersipora subatra]|uniref:uncharacterized protein n=1 Tax=Watersipora subatra TaxID=2589382 RepID=UPI00355B52E3
MDEDTTILLGFALGVIALMVLILVWVVVYCLCCRENEHYESKQMNSGHYRPRQQSETTGSRLGDLPELPSGKESIPKLSGQQGSMATREGGQENEAYEPAYTDPIYSYCDSGNYQYQAPVPLDTHAYEGMPKAEAPSTMTVQYTRNDDTLQRDMLEILRTARRTASIVNEGYVDILAPQPTQNEYDDNMSPFVRRHSLVDRQNGNDDSTLKAKRNLLQDSESKDVQPSANIFTINNAIYFRRTDGESTIPILSNESTTNTQSIINACSSELTINPLSSESTINAISKEQAINAPSTESTIDAPRNESTIDAQGTDSTIHTCSTESTINALSNELAIDAHETESTINTCSNESTTNTLRSESTTNACSSELTINPLSSESTINAVSQEQAINAPSTESTIDALRNESTIGAQGTESTIHTCSNESTINALSNELAIDAHETESMINTCSNESTINALRNESIIDAHETESTINTCSNESTINTRSNECIENFELQDCCTTQEKQSRCSSETSSTSATDIELCQILKVDIGAASDESSSDYYNLTEWLLDSEKLHCTDISMQENDFYVKTEGPGNVFETSLPQVTRGSSEVPANASRDNELTAADTLSNKDTKEDQHIIPVPRPRNIVTTDEVANQLNSETVPTNADIPEPKPRRSRTPANPPPYDQIVDYGQ